MALRAIVEKLPFSLLLIINPSNRGTTTQTASKSLQLSRKLALNAQTSALDDENFEEKNLPVRLWFQEWFDLKKSCPSGNPYGKGGEGRFLRENFSIISLFN